MPLALSEGFHAGGLYALGLLGLGLALAVGIAALSHQHERAFSAALIYVFLGALGALAMSILDVSPIDPLTDHGLIERLSELALVVAVFSAGLTVERHVRKRSVVSVAILLLVVMPLTVALIAVFGYYAMGLSIRRCSPPRCDSRSDGPGPGRGRWARAARVRAGRRATVLPAHRGCDQRRACVSVRRPRPLRRD